MAMVPKHAFTLLMVFVAFQATTCQNAEEPPIDVGGSGDGPAELTAVASSVDNAPIIDEADNIDAAMNLLNNIDNLNESTIKPDTRVIDDEIDSTLLTSIVDGGSVSNKSACNICACDEKDDDFIVDCSNKSLAEIPEFIDERTTILNLEYNKLEQLPKSIGTLTNLIHLNVNNNELKEIEFGSVSMLSNLKTLNLANNKFTEIPLDLKNSFVLTDLTNLTLSGNNITQITPETFLQFKSLKTIKLDNVTEELFNKLCNLVNITLEEVCKADSCKKCSYMFENDPVHPSLIAADNDYLEHKTTTAAPSTVASNASKAIEATTEFSLKNIVDKELSGRKAAGPPVDTEKKMEDIKTKVDAKVDAKSNEESSGGVSTLLVGLVVAGMVLVVVIVVVKKNWSRITSSSSRPAAERLGTSNGTTPEEVPLREKPNPA